MFRYSGHVHTMNVHSIVLTASVFFGMGITMDDFKPGNIFIPTVTDFNTQL